MMPVGTQSAIAASFAAHVAHHAATHAAVRATVDCYRNAALLELADRYLGELPEVLIEVLGLKTVARRVLISAEQQRHAISRRQTSSQVDADLVATRLAEALANVRWQLLPQKDPRVFEVLGYVPSADRCLLLPLKLVAAADAETRQDEWWLQTAHPFGATNFRRAQARGYLRNVQAGPMPSNYRIERTRDP